MRGSFYKNLQQQRKDKIQFATQTRYFFLNPIKFVDFFAIENTSPQTQPSVTKTEIAQPCLTILFNFLLLLSICNKNFDCPCTVWHNLQHNQKNCTYLKNRQVSATVNLPYLNFEKYLVFHSQDILKNSQILGGK